MCKFIVYVDSRRVGAYRFSSKAAILAIAESIFLGSRVTVYNLGR
jgi:hypothetical protein